MIIMIKIIIMIITVIKIITMLMRKRITLRKLRKLISTTISALITSSKI